MTYKEKATNIQSALNEIRNGMKYKTFWKCGARKSKIKLMAKKHNINEPFLYKIHKGLI